MFYQEAHSTNFKKGRIDNIKYIVVHYTANNGDTARNNLGYYNRTANLKASAHYFVDELEVCQSVKETDTAYHCGATKYKHPECRNANSIGVEICSRKYPDGKYYFLNDAVNNAVELIKKLMEVYQIPLSNVIRHYDVTGKNCPQPFVNSEKEWNEFKEKLVHKPKIESANDIDYALKWKYAITFDNAESEKEFVRLLDEEKQKGSKLYWVFYKLANK